ncbi:hypothetical protein NL341_28230, partial [Klebsiella pneumoniae]|nr:hypothetical protein [Klebsiella pneumoniae]
DVFNVGINARKKFLHAEVPLMWWQFADIARNTRQRQVGQNAILTALFPGRSLSQPIWEQIRGLWQSRSQAPN